MEESAGFAIAAKRCLSSDHCKDEQEIEQFISNHRIDLLYNNQIYANSVFGDEEGVVQDLIMSQRLYLNNLVHSVEFNEIQK